MTQERKYLTDKAKEWADSVRIRRLSKYDAWKTLNCTIMRTIAYPLAATTFTRHDVDAIMRPILSTVLPKCGIQRRLPRKVLHGTNDTQGQDLKDPLVLQLIEHLHSIMRHHHRATPTTDSLWGAMEDVQTYVGSATPFWELPFAPYGRLAPSGWMKRTWEDMSDTTLTLKGPNIALPLQRIHDAHLMDLIDIDTTSDATLEALTNMRFYLRVTRVSDVVTADGRAIEDQYWTPTSSKHARSLLQHQQYPQSRRPTPNDWTLWQDFLRTALLSRYSTHRVLQRPLKQWNTAIAQDSEWIWWYDSQAHSLWQRLSDNTWQVWESHDTRSKYFRRAFSATSTEGFSPARCSVSPRPHSTVLLNFDFHSQHRPQSVPPSSLSDRLAALPSSAHWAVKRCLFQGSLITLADAIQQGTAVAVSDGSYKLRLGTSGYIITTPDISSHIPGINRVPGPLKEGDSYRCELAGTYGILLVGNAIATHYAISQGRCIIACDNDAAIRVCQPGFIPEPGEDSYDLVNAIYHLLKSSPIEWIATHVDGHKDRVSSNLSLLEQLNVRMDTLAKAYWQFLARQHSTWTDDYSIPIHEEGWQLWNGSNKVRDASQPTLYSIIQDPITVNYWVRHNRISSESAHLIDWKSNGNAFRAMKLGKRRRVSKHASKDCGVGTTLVNWKLQDDDACPRCGHSETTEHVIRCPKADEQWTTELSSLQSKLTAIDTDPEIQSCFVDSLHAWRHGLAMPHMQAAHNPLLHQAFQEQCSIGWFQFIEGLLSTKWKEAQAIHYSSIDTRRTSQYWCRRTIQLLHTLTDNLWHHRNEVKHVTDQPRQKRMRRLLDQEIVQEFAIGPTDLPQGDATHLFNRNIVTLLQSTTNYKQAWLYQTAQARQRHQRKRQHDDDLSTISLHQSKLFKWARTGVTS